MEKVEDIINYQDEKPYAIFVSGDFHYDSKIKSLKNIHLILSNGHYTIDKKTITKKSRQTYEEKPIIIVEKLEDVYYTYDGKQKSTITRQEYDESRLKIISNPFLIVEKDFTAATNKLSIIEAYNYYIEMADQLKKESKGLLNMYKCPTIKNIALNYFYDLTKLIQPEEINNNEALWINKASSHAITYFQKYEGHVDVYDINSHYPYNMQISNNMFPIKSGEYKMISKIKDKPDFGIYRCIISGDGVYKFFVFNKENYYTHSDILVARDYGLKVELIEDENPNFLYYSNECLISGSTLFKKYVNTLYEYKKNNVKGAKLLLNILWGALTEKKIYKEKTSLNNSKDLSNMNITRLQTIDNINGSVHYTKKDDSQFRTNYGRIKPFVLAYGRNKLYFRYKKFENLIVRIHTDSLYLTSTPEDLPPVSDKLGLLKHEYSGNIKILGLNKVIKSNK